MSAPDNSSTTAHEDLQMLGLVLKAAFRSHCTGETICDRRPWELVRHVQERLMDLSDDLEPAVSEQRLRDYMEMTLFEPPATAEAACALAQAPENMSGSAGALHAAT